MLAYVLHMLLEDTGYFLAGMSYFLESSLVVFQLARN